MGVVDDAVEDGVGQGRITDQIVPSVDRDLAGDQRGTSTGSFLGDLQKVAPLFRTEGFTAPVIQDQQLHSAERPHQPGVTAIAVRQRQIGEQSGDTLVEHRVIVAARLMSKRAGEPRLSNPGRAFDDQVLLCLDPAAERQLLEQRAVETTRRATDDIFDSGLLAQPGVAQTRLEPAILTIREFAVEQQSEPFGVIEFATTWVGGQFLIGARHSSEAELA